MSSTSITRTYTEEQIRATLIELALCGGNVSEAARKTGVNRKSISDWRGKDPARYEQIQRDVVSRLHERLAAQSEAIAQRATAVELEAIDKLQQQIASEGITGKDLPQAIKALGITFGIHAEKSLLLRNRPTQIVETRDVAQALRRLEELGVIEGAAVEESS